MVRALCVAIFALALPGPAFTQPAPKVMGADALAQIRATLLENAAKSANGSATNIFTQTPTYIGEFVGRVRTGEAEEHQLWIDEVIVREGEIELVTGGTMEGRHPTGPAGEFRGSGLSGGTSRRLHPGDVVEIPAGMLHWMKVLPGGPAVTLVYKVK